MRPDKLIFDNFKKRKLLESDFYMGSKMRYSGPNDGYRARRHNNAVLISVHMIQFVTASENGRRATTKKVEVRSKFRTRVKRNESRTIFSLICSLML